MLNKRVLRIFVGGVAMLGAVATSEADCYTPPSLFRAIQLQSLTIDGVEQADLTEYQKGQSAIAASRYSGHFNGFDINYFGTYGETYDPQ